MDTKNLVERFAEANLELVIVNRPLVLGRGNEDIVQVDIQRKLNGNMRDELFQLYIGDETADVQVLSIDKDISQLVLMVHERARTYTRNAWNKSPAASLARGEKVVSDKNGHLVIEGKTSDDKVRYLMGRDERQLFIARLPSRITTVAEAHRSLKGADVSFAEGKARGRTVRQGEWFFINITEAERKAIQEAIKKNKASIEHKAVIQRERPPRGWRAGKPHVADELIRLPGAPLAHGFAVNSVEIFVRGRIRHSDHETVSFKEWRKVIRNAETGGGNGRWID